jgi:hypothetical protein
VENWFLTPSELGAILVAGNMSYHGMHISTDNNNNNNNNNNKRLN